jgi:hypothetical protein
MKETQKLFCSTPPPSEIPLPYERNPELLPLHAYGPCYTCENFQKTTPKNDIKKDTKTETKIWDLKKFQGLS